MGFRTKAIIGGFVATVGFVAAAIGLWDRFFPPTPDNEIFLLPMDAPDVTLSNSNQEIDTNYLKANNLLIDGVKLTVTDGGLLVANKIVMKNGGEIYGANLYIVSTIIDDGLINSTSSKGMDGGNIFVAIAQINGTEIISNGKNGVNGGNGKNGTNGAPGANGRNGDCSGFGGWRSAHAGGIGENGSNGEDGESGQDGGNAGNITILTSYALTTEPESRGGSGGKGGKGGAPGLGGKGGRGGRGCTGLGGAQSTQPSGPDGNDGVPGKDGQDGQNGADHIATVKLISFNAVKEAFQEFGDNKDKFVTQLRSIRPRK